MPLMRRALLLTMGYKFATVWNLGASGLAAQTAPFDTVFLQVGDSRIDVRSVAPRTEYWQIWSVPWHPSAEDRVKLTGRMVARITIGKQASDSVIVQVRQTTYPHGAAADTLLDSVVCERRTLAVLRSRRHGDGITAGYYFNGTQVTYFRSPTASDTGISHEEQLQEQAFLPGTEGLLVHVLLPLLLSRKAVYRVPLAYYDPIRSRFIVSHEDIALLRPERLILQRQPVETWVVRAGASTIWITRKSREIVKAESFTPESDCCFTRLVREHFVN